MTALRLDLSLCRFDKDRKALAFAHAGARFPGEVMIRSHHTKRTVRFVPVQPGHPAWDEDGWDGEQQVYAPVVPLPNVATLTLYRAE